MAETHKIIHRLKILDQIIFHMDNDQLHSIAAIHDKNNSGADVQMAKIVNHINKSDTLKCFAILTLVLIRLFAENINKYNQTTNVMIAESIVFFVCKRLLF